MDIIKKIRPLKATYLSLSLKHKFGIIITLLSLITFLLPHETFASSIPDGRTSGSMIFVIGDQVTYLNNLNLQLTKYFERKQMQKDLDRQLLLAARVRNYLRAQGSPLANYASTLIQLNNWKKIIALSNAESSFCKHYPADKANCWGIGGSDLWYMGSNLGEGIITMNNFLNAYPNNSLLKYSDMTFKQMNGVYKQPPKDHWVQNNQSVYNDLVKIENSL